MSTASTVRALETVESDQGRQHVEVVRDPIVEINTARLFIKTAQLYIDLDLPAPADAWLSMAIGKIESARAQLHVK